MAALRESNSKFEAASQQSQEELSQRELRETKMQSILETLHEQYILSASESRELSANLSEAQAREEHFEQERANLVADLSIAKAQVL